MRTPASRWRPSPRRYDPNPPRWQYAEGAKVLKVDCQGKLDRHGQKWKISKALCGEWVQIVRVEQRLQVYYCTTMIRELDLGIQRSTNRNKVMHDVMNLRSTAEELLACTRLVLNGLYCAGIGSATIS